MRVFPERAERADPYAFYGRMRAAHPVARDEEHDVWAVFGFDEVRRVLGEWELFSSDLRHAPERLRRRRLRSSLLGSDPPRHTKLRSLVSSAFTPAVVAGLEPRIRELADELIDRVVEDGRMDLVQDLSYPLPVTVIAELLGVPPGDRDRYGRWADALVGAGDDVFVDDEAADERRRRTIEEMDDYFRSVLAHRRARPHDDLVGRLASAEVEGERLSEEETLAFCELLLLAGHVTTTNLLANMTRALLHNPDQMRLLIERRASVETAVEEALRYDSPVQGLGRFTVREAEIGGVRIPAGRLVVAWIASANRDASRFPHPDRFDVARSPNPHIAFGVGLHF